MDSDTMEQDSSVTDKHNHPSTKSSLFLTYPPFNKNIHSNLNRQTLRAYWFLRRTEQIQTHKRITGLDPHLLTVKISQKSLHYHLQQYKRSSHCLELHRIKDNNYSRQCSHKTFKTSWEQKHFKGMQKPLKTLDGLYVNQPCCFLPLAEEAKRLTKEIRKEQEAQQWAGIPHKQLLNQSFTEQLTCIQTLETLAPLQLAKQHLPDDIIDILETQKSGQHPIQPVILHCPKLCRPLLHKHY